MKSGTSSLNPFAESYIPLSKREPKNEGKTSEITAEKSPKSSGETTWFDTRSQGPKETKQIYLQSDASFDLNLHGIEELLIGEDFMKKGHENPSNETEKYYTDEDSQMDLAYLGTLFPGISDQSLLDVYTANGGDLEASIDMLNQLEFYPVDARRHLPESLDIGDVSDVKSSAEGSSKLKGICPGEACGPSSSGPSPSP